MPKIKRFKTYPFPFLAEYTKDYKKTKFILNLHYTSEKGMVKFQADYSINNDELVESIKDGTIEVAVKIVCRRMGFSKTFEVPRRAKYIRMYSYTQTPSSVLINKNKIEFGEKTDWTIAPEDEEYMKLQLI